MDKYYIILKNFNSEMKQEMESEKKPENKPEMKRFYLNQETEKENINQGHKINSSRRINSSPRTMKRNLSSENFIKYQWSWTL